MTTYDLLNKKVSYEPLWILVKIIILILLFQLFTVVIFIVTAHRYNNNITDEED
jgi:hypothetical protein